MKSKKLKNGPNSRINTIKEQISDVKNCTEKLSQNVARMEKVEEQHEIKVKKQTDMKTKVGNQHQYIKAPNQENMENAEETIFGDIKAR